jgi:predicted nuclease of predicted toxin-antitoxin system
VVWDFALREGFTLVTEDTDFNDLAVLRGSPPKVVWLRIGNCTTGQIEELLRRHQEAIEQFQDDASAGVLALL